MRRFIQVWLVLSIIATAVFGYLYVTGDRTRSVTVEFSDGTRIGTESAPGGAPATRSLRPDGAAQSAPAVQSESLALTISIASSIISAIAAIAQTWLTHRAIRNGRYG